MNNNIEQLCINYNLGSLENPPVPVTGGLLHTMYHVSTTQGEYALKVLNPDIMKRPEALQNMINSEIVSSKLKGIIPLVAAKDFLGEKVISCDDSYYMIFDWLDGASVFAPDITKYHCEQIGRILGKIHAANILVDGMEKSTEIRSVSEWKQLLEIAEPAGIAEPAKITEQVAIDEKEEPAGDEAVEAKLYAECCSVLKENLSDIVYWDQRVVDGWSEISGKQVISHRDLDPKNVMWKEEKPYIIDWEAAGYVNPYLELIEVLNYWIVEESGEYNRGKFDALLQAYTESVDIHNVNWEVVLNCSFGGMLGWLEYNVKRALGLEGTKKRDREEGLHQTKETIGELRKAATRITQLKEWLNNYYIGNNV